MNTRAIECRRNWSHGSESNLPTWEIEKGKKKVIPFEKIWQMARESKDGGRFRCPICKFTFGVNVYGIFGKVSCIAEPAMYCRDCAKDISLIRVR